MNRKRFLFVDGYNIINAWPHLVSIKNNISLSASREELINILSEFQALGDEKVYLVFDAYLAKGERTIGERDYKNIKIYFTKEKETADSYIERILDLTGKKDIIRVATDDNLIQQTILSRGGTRLSSEELLIEYNSLKKQLSRMKVRKPDYQQKNLVTLDEDMKNILDEISKNLKE
ncbi:NYN domain-containing protein [Lagierella sp.]|uniref:NYN domain-containing protein n=1 Tax=Lagierella sp. TaxID=2849657 RepID=UPI00262888AD|nr:NYN domain-containing protein [Lagierella sp.]